MILPLRQYHVCILLLLVSGCMPVVAQSGVLTGTILDNITGRGIDNALVLNYSTRHNAYTGIHGDFTLDVRLGDTVVLSAVGYYYKRLVVNDSIWSASAPVKFYFTPRAYEITEARIIGLGSYQDFKSNFIELKRPKTQIEKLIENLGDIARIEGKEAYDQALATGRLEPPRAGIPIRSPEEKERIALAKILEKEQIREQGYLKFNPEVIKKVTSLTEDRDILDFMTFCNFSDDYLMEISEYDLAARIVEKFEEYKTNRVNIF